MRWERAGRIEQVTLEQYPTDAVIRVKRKRLELEPVKERPKRGKVTEFSAKSRRGLLFKAFNAGCAWLAFAVLTYPSEFPMDGRKVKRDVKVLMQSISETFGYEWLWGLEFQERGAAHINLLLSGFVPKEWLSKRWFEIVGSGDPKHLIAGTRIEGLYGRDSGGAYMAKAYAAKKGSQKEVPKGFENVGRFWGASRGLVKAVETTELGNTPESREIIRVCRKFTEKQIRPRRSQPERDGVKRKRKVRRARKLQHLHTGLNGFTVFKGGPVVARLLTPTYDVDRATGEIIPRVVNLGA